MRSLLGRQLGPLQPAALAVRRGSSQPSLELKQQLDDNLLRMAATDAIAP